MGRGRHTKNSELQTIGDANAIPVLPQTSALDILDLTLRRALLSQLAREQRLF